VLAEWTQHHCLAEVVGVVRPALDEGPLPAVALAGMVGANQASVVDQTHAALALRRIGTPAAADLQPNKHTHMLGKSPSRTYTRT